jgi:SAM-dependent methyltransferase
MDEMHQANKYYWDEMAAHWQNLRDQDQQWRLCPKQPELAFEGEALAMIRDHVGELEGKRVCVIGSGDNYAAFALAGMGASVTSTDISANQLEIARQRADRMGLSIHFQQADATQMEGIGQNAFDLVVSTNGFFVWIAEPDRVFRQVARILKPGGYYIFYDIHPFQRPWKDQVNPLEMEKPYSSTGPFQEEEIGRKNFQFNWRISDLLNPLCEAGLILRRLAESPARDARFWEGDSYLPGSDSALLDWRNNPRAGLPVWLSVAAQKGA